TLRRLQRHLCGSRSRAVTVRWPSVLISWHQASPVASLFPLFSVTPTLLYLNLSTQGTKVVHQFASHLVSLSYPQLFRRWQRNLVASRAPPAHCINFSTSISHNTRPRPLVLASA
ncbi:hypothetical protein CORC01_09407, partial [Colletotrichum orchidophilum]